MKVYRIVFVVALVLGTKEVSAHHSVSATYDTSKLVSFSGEVTKVGLLNPHATIELAVKDGDGNVTTWLIEMAPPNALKRTVDLKIFQIGQRLTVESWLAKNGRNEASGRTVITPDGKRIDVGDSWMEAQVRPGTK